VANKLISRGNGHAVLGVTVIVRLRDVGLRRRRRDVNFTLAMTGQPCSLLQ
jgi:hypothetical protein